MKYLPLGELYPDIRNGFVGTVTPFFSNKENGVLYLRGTNVHDGVISNEDAKICLTVPPVVIASNFFLPS